jgi:hypothetical protein
MSALSSQIGTDKPEVIPPPPIPAIALAAIRVFILGAKAHNVVPKPILSYIHPPELLGEDVLKNDTATIKLAFRPMILHSLP